MTLFDATLFKNVAHPLPGLKPIRVFYTSEIWQRSRYPLMEIPPRERMIEIAELAKGQLTCFDIEHWPYQTAFQEVNDAQAHASLARLGEFADILHRIDPSLRTGFYAMVTHRGAVWQLPKVQRDNGRVLYGRGPDGRFTAEGLADRVDVVFPGIYCRPSDLTSDMRARWVSHAKQVIRDARRWHSQIYPFVWHEYHDVSVRKGQPIEPDFWRIMLETCLEYADGACIWSNGKTAWDENAPWWQVTQDVLEKVEAMRDYRSVYIRPTTEAAWPLQEVGGSTISDLMGIWAGTDHPGTVVGSPTFDVAGPIARSMSRAMGFSAAAANYITINDAADLRFTSGETITIRAWINTGPLTSSTTPRYIVGKGRISGAAATDQEWSLRIINNADGTWKPSFLYRSAASFHEWSTNATFPQNVWSHVAIVYTFATAASIKAYVDGVEYTAGTWGLGTGAVAPVAPNQPVWIGTSLADGSTSRFVGSMAWIAVDRGNFTTADSQAHYLTGRNGVNNFAGIVA